MVWRSKTNFEPSAHRYFQPFYLVQTGEALLTLPRPASWDTNLPVTSIDYNTIHKRHFRFVKGRQRSISYRVFRFFLMINTNHALLRENHSINLIFSCRNDITIQETVKNDIHVLQWSSFHLLSDCPVRILYKVSRSSILGYCLIPCIWTAIQEELL